MDATTERERLDTVRAFNRTVTARVGALEEHYLASDRSLGASRVLWEIGERGLDVRELRERLGLDSGYLSRLLRGLEREGIVMVETSVADARVRTARLTDDGRRERDTLDERSDALASSVLEPLSARQRDRLVEAMATVSALLDAGSVVVEPADAGSPEARACLEAYFAELAERFPGGFDAGRSLHPGTEGFAPPTGAFVLARLHGAAIGCGGLLFQDDGSAYLKRMWVSPTARGLGVGRRLLTELETIARAAGAHSAVLETNDTLAEAIAMYGSAGYAEVAPFNAERYADRWFAKRL